MMFIKLKNNDQKESAKNKLKPKGMVLYTHRIKISMNFHKDNFDVLQKLGHNRSRLGYMCPRGHCSTSSETHLDKYIIIQMK